MQILPMLQCMISPQASPLSETNAMYRLSNSFPYLIARLGVRMGELFTQVIRADGLSLQMYRVLAVLLEENRALKLVELAGLTSADVSTLSRIISDMQRKGLLLRERPENDQRSLQVTLTRKGRDLAERYMPVAERYEQISIRSLAPEQARALRATLVQLYDNLNQLEQELAQGEIDALIGRRGKTTRNSPTRSEPGKGRTKKPGKKS
jgi:MarR family transcriptional regulator, organic hydroperoxide resistance regulator